MSKYDFLTKSCVDFTWKALEFVQAGPAAYMAGRF